MKKLAISLVFAVSYCCHFLGFCLDKMTGWDEKEIEHE